MLNEKMSHPEKHNQKVGEKLTIIYLFSLFVIATMAGILFGVRLVAFGAPGGQVEMLMFAWGGVVFILGLLLAIPYLLGVPLVSGDWRVVMLSVFGGFAVLMFLYPRLPITTLQYLAKPVENPTLHHAGRLALIGGIDGLFLGTTVGLLMLFVDPELQVSNRQNLLRFVILAIVIASSIIVSFVLNEMSDFLDLVANFVPIAVVFLLKLGLKYRDRIHYPQK